MPFVITSTGVLQGILDSVRIAIRVLEELDKLDQCDLTLASASCEQFLTNLQVGSGLLSCKHLNQPRFLCYCACCRLSFRALCAVPWGSEPHDVHRK